MLINAIIISYRWVLHVGIQSFPKTRGINITSSKFRTGTLFSVPNNKDRTLQQARPVYNIWSWAPRSENVLVILNCSPRSLVQCNWKLIPSRQRHRWGRIWWRGAPLWRWKTCVRKNIYIKLKVSKTKYKRCPFPGADIRNIWSEQCFGPGFRRSVKTNNRKWKKSLCTPSPRYWKSLTED